MSIFTVKCFDQRSFSQGYFWFIFLFSRAQKEVNKSVWIQLCNHPDQNLELFQLSRRLHLTRSQSVSATGGQRAELCHHRFILLSVTSCEWNHTDGFVSGACSSTPSVRSWILCATSFSFSSLPSHSFIFIKSAKEEK